MNKIQVDGVDYVDSKSFYDLEVKYEDLLKEKEKSNDASFDNKFSSLKIKYMDEASIMGMGSFKPKGEWIHCRVSIKCLENALKSLSWLTYDKKRNDDRSIVFMFAKEMPLILGNFDEDKKEGSGIVLAPRFIKEDD